MLDIICEPDEFRATVVPSFASTSPVFIGCVVLEILQNIIKIHLSGMSKQFLEGNWTGRCQYLENYGIAPVLQMTCGFQWYQYYYWSITPVDLQQEPGKVYSKAKSVTLKDDTHGSPLNLAELWHHSNLQPWKVKLGRLYIFSLCLAKLLIKDNFTVSPNRRVTTLNPYVMWPGTETVQEHLLISTFVRLVSILQLVFAWIVWLARLWPECLALQSCSFFI